MERKEIHNLIVSCCCKVLPELESHAFTAEDHMEDLGISSLERSEIVMMVLEALSTSMPRTQALAPRSIGELADFLYGKQRAV